MDMRTKFFEVVGTLNWGKFMVADFTGEEWRHRSEVTGVSLIRYTGWGSDHRLVIDLQTGEGAVFAVRPGGMPRADLAKHKIWVCPMFEPFLEWLYQQDLDRLDELPQLIELMDAPASMHGYRREGSDAG